MALYLTRKSGGTVSDFRHGTDGRGTAQRQRNTNCSLRIDRDERLTFGVVGQAELDAVRLGQRPVQFRPVRGPGPDAQFERSSGSQADAEEADLDRERGELEAAPEVELQELAGKSRTGSTS